MQVRSLSARLLASVSVLLVIFFGLTIVALDLVFRDISERAILDRLEVQVLALLSVSEESMRGGLEPAPQLAESRYNSPGSGLYGEIRRTDDAATWRSNSMVGTGLDFGAVMPPGQRRSASCRSRTVPRSSRSASASPGNSRTARRAISSTAWPRTSIRTTRS